MHRIHITGASGSGTTTLGRALAERLGLPHHDADDYYWLPSDPPYAAKRPPEDRVRLVRDMFLPRNGWVLSGSMDSWGGEIVPLLDLIVLLSTATDVRLARLEDRQGRQFGRASVAPGGRRHADTQSFLDWASHYDDGSQEGRSRPRHEAWLAGLDRPVLRLDGGRPVEELVGAVLARLGRDDLA